MALEKLKSWLIHKLGGATPTELSTIISGYAARPVQFERTELPVHILSCEMILPDGLSDWSVLERDLHLCNELAKKLLESELVKISTTPVSSYSSIVRATLKAVPPTP